MKSSDNEITTLKIFTDSHLARLANDQLKAEGIEAFLEDENVLGLNPSGGFELKVFTRDLQRAREILEQ